MLERAHVREAGPEAAIPLAHQLIDFARRAGVELDDRTGIVAGDDAVLALALQLAAPPGCRLLAGPDAPAGLRTPSDDPRAGRVVINDPLAIPVESHAYRRLILLGGALGGQVGFVARLGEVRRLLRPDGTLLLDTGPLPRGAPDGRLDLAATQRALAIAGLAITKVRLDVPVTRLAVGDHRIPFSVAGVERALLLAAPLG